MVTMRKSKIIGIYGLPGAVKTTILDQLKRELDASKFKCFEGSDELANFCIGNLENFEESPEEEKLIYRLEAIARIRQQCEHSGQAGVVSGHCSFWSEGERSPTRVLKPKDYEAYTHIIYLHVPPGQIKRQRTGNKKWQRAEHSEDHIAKWQSEEIRVQGKCRDNDILFAVLRQSDRSAPVQYKVYDKVVSFLAEFEEYSAGYNQRVVLDQRR
jgi:adenylate kinase